VIIRVLIAQQKFNLPGFGKEEIENVWNHSEFQPNLEMVMLQLNWPLPNCENGNGGGGDESDGDDTSEKKRIFLN